MQAEHMEHFEPEPGLRRREGGRDGGRMGVAASLVMNSTMHAPISKKDTVTLGGNIASHRGLGGGSIILGVRRHCSEVSQLELSAAVGLQTLLGIEATRQITSNARASVAYNYVAGEGLGLTLSVMRQLYNNQHANISWALGPSAGLSTGWTYQNEKIMMNTNVHLGPAYTALAGTVMRNLEGNKAHMRASFKLATTALEIEVGGSRRVSANSSLALSVSVSLKGIILKFRFTRAGQKFVFPVILCPVIRLDVLAAACVLPPAAVYALQKTVLGPAADRRRRRKAMQAQAENAEVVARGRAQAAEAVQLMAITVERKRTREEAKGGLVIMEARFGCLSGVADFHAPDDPDAQQPWLEVGTALQFLVENSRLEINGDITKSNLMGFCDPCPNQKKALYIKYLHNRLVHEVRTLGPSKRL
ncbi:hypothetical protein CYMTET_56429 [Cymbomonas tetramitiformis]|uniref:Uncharacterized protein n=1 Tax=Cymbomonas tetramitiformis TaxID=36881 RepID=A0AAE0EMC1_9CHLO|nr:hypothetical protein CYMTET_56429 [Cymbomonas tetramitiformis]